MERQSDKVEPGTAYSAWFSTALTQLGPKFYRVTLRHAHLPENFV